MYQVNEDLSIYVTRGDIVSFTLTATEDDTDFVFPAGSVVRLKVFEKKACENVVLQKDFAVEVDTKEVDIYLEEKDTRIGGIISKPVDYWYEVELNPFTDPQTIVGYDDDGAKIFKLFPEGRDLVDEILPEEIPIVDAELDLTSRRPIQNQAVARQFKVVETQFEDIDTELKNNKNESSEHYKNTNNPHKVTAEQLGALKSSGGTMTGSINMGAKKITNLPEAEADGDALQFGQAKEMFPNFEDFEGKADAIQSAAGTQIRVENSANTPLKGLKLHGKTTQDGTPALENTVELVSVGDDGSVNVMVMGDNLLPYPYVYGSRTVNGVTCIQNPDGSITLDGTATSTIFYNCVQELVLPDGIYSLADFGSKDAYYMRVEMIDDEPGSVWQRGTFTVENGMHVHIEIRIASGAVFDNVTIYPMVNAGETAIPWTPYTAKTITAQTPNGLSAIPVMDANHATYTDENGQMWCADEIDYGRGVYVQRVKKMTLTEADISYANSSYAEYGTYAFTTIRDALDASSDVVVISDKLVGICADYRTGSGYDDKYRCYAQSGVIYLRFPAGTGAKTLEECKAAFAGVTVQYALATPIETPLSFTELSAYEALRTYNPSTKVYNDADAYMKMDYYSPTTPMQVSQGERNAGKILGVDEQGNVVPQDGFEKFAPAGYGLGGLSVYASDPNNVTSNGFYFCDENSYGIKEDFKESVFIHMNRSETEMVQIFVNTLGEFGVRRFLAGQWGEIRTATLSGGGAVG